MELSEILIDPEFQSLIPPLSAGEREGLESSLKADGCVSPLIVWQDHNILLDGHNRYDICRRQNIACKFHQVVLASREAAKAWIIRHQLGRRNLKESQRAMLAVALKEMFTAGAMQRKTQGRKAGGHARQGDSSILSNLTASSSAREEAAAAMNVSSGLVHAAEKIKSHGTEKLQQAVLAGEVSASAAAKVATLPRGAAGSACPGRQGCDHSRRQEGASSARRFVENNLTPCHEACPQIRAASAQNRPGITARSALGGQGPYQHI